jgi:hypothetical protein
MANFPLAIEACDFALGVDEDNDKSYFLRAKSRLAPNSSCAEDESLARSDLKMALKRNPNNKEARKLLQKLDSQLKLRKRKDKEQFGGLFDRGEVYDAQELNEKKERSRKAAEQERADSRRRDLILGKQLVQLYEERGMMETERHKLESSIHEMRAATDNNKNAHLNNLDFRNPNEKMIQDAKAMGVDLKDEKTVELLEKMREEAVSSEAVVTADPTVENKREKVQTVELGSCRMKLLTCIAGMACLILILIVMYLMLWFGGI